ncbi:hypothetical protein C8R43DRAFT_1153763 [Mycena crocata]|nr:hypothetical protein C8R43DRAFT_1153763 [Mycena crocata]
MSFTLFAFPSDDLRSIRIIRFPRFSGPPPAALRIVEPFHSPDLRPPVLSELPDSFRFPDGPDLRRAYGPPFGSVYNTSHTHTFSVHAITGTARSADRPIPTYINRTSTDNLRAYREFVPVAPPSPVKQYRAEQAAAAAAAAAPPAPPPLPSDDFVGPTPYQMSGLDSDEPPPPPPSKKPVKLSDPALHRWRTRRNEYGAALLWRDGVGHASAILCRSCKVPGATPSFRCTSGFGDDLLCAGCCVDRHAHNPLHRIECWNGKFFGPASLHDLGLRVQLGHPVGEKCSTPDALSENFLLLHTNGFHRVAVDACDCEHAAVAGPPEIQLIRAGWYPATDDKPKTCATFEVLDEFLMSTLQAKTTMYDFYAMLEKLTDNTGLKQINRYHAWLRMCREWRHLLMLKRAGIFHSVLGFYAVRPGQLAVLCPCCPRPGENIPDGWETAPPGQQFLYIIFLAIDACFRLKRRLIASDLKDPSLGPGWSYLTERSPYREYLLDVTDQSEMSTCSGLAALDYANTKFSRGYSATGVGMGVCARHEFVQPNGVGDLQKGERYANMDYIFASILRHLDVRMRKIVSYDIVCQWWKGLVRRLASLPPLLRLNLAMHLFRFVIPKMHIHGHKLDCQRQFSLNLVPGSAQTDGEGIEASSTREMGPGSREDVLSCHWGHWNWQKLVGMATALRRRTDRANIEYASQLEGFTTFSMQQEARVPAWRAMVVAFEADPKKPNPYEAPFRGITEKQVLLQFSQEEAQQVQAGVPSIHNVSPSSFVAAALEVEDQQRRVRVQAALKKAATTAMQINLVQMRNQLHKSIRRLRKLQSTYTPASLLALAARVVPKEEEIEEEPLFLPSALSAAQRAGPVMMRLSVIEDQMRDAQCSTALLHARHQGANTRSRTLVARNESKIRLHSEKYQTAWEAKRRLAGGDPGAVGWQILRAADIRPMQDAEELKRQHEKRKEAAKRRNKHIAELVETREIAPLSAEERATERESENVREVSWIWKASGTAGTDAELEDALRIEWCKAYARTRRWEEESRLLEEEVRRLPLSLEARAVEWDAREEDIAAQSIASVAEAQGKRAYAAKQATMYRAIALRVRGTMTEIIKGRGKRRRAVEEGEQWMDADGNDKDSDESEGEQSEQEDRVGDLPSDEEFVLGGGGDDD